jgi:hypothetical protein
VTSTAARTPEEKEIPNPATRKEHDSGTVAGGYHEAGTTTDAWVREEEEERARVPIDEIWAVSQRRRKA